MSAVAALLASATIIVVGDGIPTPLTATPGDVQRGRQIAASRQQGLCLLCHNGPAEAFPQERQFGSLAPSLAGAGSRLNEAQLRLRIVDSQRLNPSSLMPAFHRTEGLNRVGSAWHGKPVLDAQQVEDVVAFLRTLQ
jgi:sulfur-oxidizing protein SoxX